MDDFLNLFCVVIRHLSYSPHSLGFGLTVCQVLQRPRLEPAVWFFRISYRGVHGFLTRAHTHKVGRMSDNVEAMVEHPYTLSPNISRTDDE